MESLLRHQFRRVLFRSRVDFTIYASDKQAADQAIVLLDKMVDDVFIEKTVGAKIIKEFNIDQVHYNIGKIRRYIMVQTRDICRTFPVTTKFKEMRHKSCSKTKKNTH